ncbi:hypothetical protein [Tolypothrix sp. VBCCA 56010]|uniref:hypothetical protein n=1 Tax=Tolypothrix sp. VBCCA 56010 TaxID=3137731 RepID=UPI003D7E1365
MTNKLQQAVFMVSTLFVLGIQPGLAETREQNAIANIPSIREIKLPLTSAEMLVQLPTSEVVQVTGVKANPTDKGVEVILQTTKGHDFVAVLIFHSQLAIASPEGSDRFFKPRIT